MSDVAARRQAASDVRIYVTTSPPPPLAAAALTGVSIGRDSLMTDRYTQGASRAITPPQPRACIVQWIPTCYTVLQKKYTAQPPTIISKVVL